LVRSGGLRQTGVVLGPILIVVALLALPVIVVMAGAVAAAGLSFVLQRRVDQEYEGTEYAESR
jgi:hypothetical protein